MVLNVDMFLNMFFLYDGWLWWLIQELKQWLVQPLKMTLAIPEYDSWENDILLDRYGIGVFWFTVPSISVSIHQLKVQELNDTFLVSTTGHYYWLTIQVHQLLQWIFKNPWTQISKAIYRWRWIVAYRCLLQSHFRNPHLSHPLRHRNLPGFNLLPKWFPGDIATDFEGPASQNKTFPMLPLAMK